MSHMPEGRGEQAGVHGVPTKASGFEATPEAPGFVAYTRDGDKPAAAHHPVTYRIDNDGLTVTAGTAKWIYLEPAPVTSPGAAQVKIGLFDADGILIVYWSVVVHGGQELKIRTGLITEFIAG